MSFLKKLFSSDQRAALAAEAAGDFELAAERYAVAGQYEAAVRMHIARAERAKTRIDEISALRDAVHWAKEDAVSLLLARKALGKALLAQAQAEGVETERDKERIREAASLLLKAQLYEHAGDALASIGDQARAADAYRAGGLVAKLEFTLNREEERLERARSEQNDFTDYDMHMRGGARDAALHCLRRCLQSAETRGDYRRLADELESRLITGGRVVLRPRRGPALTFCAAPEILIGRDALCDMVLRTGGVSRRHASIAIVSKDGRIDFELGDAGSRNGTRLGGMAIESRLSLVDRGTFQLGDELEVHFEVRTQEQVLLLEVRKGLDSGTRLYATRDGQFMSLRDLGVQARLFFKDGRPIVEHPGPALVLNGERLAHGDVQLIQGDSITIDGIDLEVA